MQREVIIVIVGFLGAGKTTLLKHLVSDYKIKGWSPFVILNDYENAYVDLQQFTEQLAPKWISGLSGSCICCTGIHELRNTVNTIPKRESGITLVEANGTSDACSLMGFLGVGLNDRFLPPIQISVVDIKNWQKRGVHNELEANQIQVSSLIVLTHVENLSTERKNFVTKELALLNPFAEIINLEEIDVLLLSKLFPSKNEAQKFDHLKTHWSSCSINLPNLPNSNCIYTICNALPKSILRIKGCTKVGKEKQYTFFERTPDGTIHIRPFKGTPTVGSKLLAVGPGSEISLLKKAVENSL